MATPLHTEPRSQNPDPVPRLSEIARCLDCGTWLVGRDQCPGCGRPYPEQGGIVSVFDRLHGRNRIAAAFYDGPGWARFRLWERLFLKVQGGEARARRQILRHLKAPRSARVLEVGIGDGANLARLPEGWSAFGVDLSRKQLEDCLKRDHRMAGRLALAEAEALPFADATFDACWSLGGFNYFANHDAALREMKRVTKPGGVLVVADEIPNLHRFGIGHLIGLKSIDAFWLGSLGLDPEFIEMVFNHEFNPDPIVKDAWPDAVRHRIWGGLGYCYVDGDSQTRIDTDRILATPTHRRYFA